MFYRVAADGLVLFHLLFILFVLCGGLLVLKWHRLWWWHLPAVAWGAAVEGFHWSCPLTGWENQLRLTAGEAGHGDSFIEHYLWPLIYPTGLTPGIQIWLGILVLLINVLVYLLLLRQWKSGQSA
ncbi:DUF2784 domain-containing protein [Pseudomonas sp. H11T01]|uniref:DUF2784 domain-containing protein n=1 Tax=Pseudomonas sp. H11T01 TaxID=3402749 RepID=UPI003ACBD8DD